MLENQGQSHLISLTKKFIGFWLKHTVRVIADISKETKQNNKAVGIKSIRELVKRGRDIEVSNEITSKDELKYICKKCKRSGIPFAVKKTEAGFQIIYERNNSAVLKDIIADTINKNLSQKSKLTDVFKKLENIKEPKASKNTPTKHREVSAR